MNLRKFVKLVIGFILICAALAQANLLSNGDFSLGQSDPSNPVDWIEWTSGGWTNRETNASGTYGDAANYHMALGNAGGYDAYIYQDVPAAAGVTYKLSVDASLDDWWLNSFYLKLEFLNGTGAQVGAFESSHHTQPGYDTGLPWVNYYLFGTAPAGTQFVRALLRTYGEGGTARFDNVSVTVNNDPDYNDDFQVDLTDYLHLSQFWQQASPQYDLNGDAFINIQDLEIFAQAWLTRPLPPGTETIAIDPTTTFQEIDGFGASFTDSSAWIVHEFLDTPEYLALMEDLFDPVTGAGLSYLRQPMGTSDMRRKPDYTYNEVPGDYDMSEFSIAEDQDYIIPVLQKALDINPDIKIMGSPWTAPSWMKSGESKKYQGGWLTNNPTNYSAYADYFVKYVQAYAAEGIPIDAITLQNEPLLQIGYPSMFMSASDQIQLIEYMGPKFATAGIDTKIIAYDHNWDNTTHALDILADPQAGAIVDGMAWHHYGGDVSSQTVVHNAYPAKGTYFTEGAIGTWMHAEGDFDGVLFSSANLLIKTTRNWAKTVVLWNMVMHEIGAGPITPGENGCWTCFGVITVNSTTKAVTKNGSYYGLAHASKFIRPGAKRIASTDTSSTAIKHVAYVNTDGSVVVYAVNEASDARNFRIEWKGQSLIYPLAGRSVTSFIWPNQANATVEVWVTTGNQTKLLSREADVFFEN